MTEEIVENQNIDNNSYNEQPQEQSQQWYSSLPDDLQEVANKFDSVESIVRGYVSAKELIGKKIEDFKADDFKAYSQMMFDTTGVPTSADGYQINLRESDETGFNTFSDDDVKLIKDIALEGGFTEKQAQLLYDRINEIGLNLAQDCEKYRNDVFMNSMQQLERMWGNNYEYKLRALDSSINDLLPRLTGFSADEIREELNGISAFSSPLLMSILSSIGELVTEKGSRGYANLSPMDANTQLEQMKTDPHIAEVMINPNHPEYKTVTERFRSLVNQRDGLS